MRLNHIQMSRKIAVEILRWQYYSPYDFYNNELTEEAVAEMMDGSHYAIYNRTKELIGFFCIGESAQVPVGRRYGIYERGNIDFGIGMNPQLVGQGHGYGFCTYILEWIKQCSPNKPIRLTVARFNERAVALYEKLGFQAKNTFSSDLADFITMVKQN
ncbi:hypothetical protein Plano_1708 [Planococcus sp. PAMC 21323]|uniref:GNAT family N-acetyltransferase n=1 Tax=Planococcus sp. PAMC 21323 TaxID=1526927 RepID=UPI0005708D18|nr:GNAT family N-acetyltransferase [Planococcus sp. PAMC 21323]AIY05673.1 hypothetical protein Plano_1708 [Planococcus sp. PAMC 21323]